MNYCIASQTCQSARGKDAEPRTLAQTNNYNNYSNYNNYHDYNNYNNYNYSTYCNWNTSPPNI